MLALGLSRKDKAAKTQLPASQLLLRSAAQFPAAYFLKPAPAASAVCVTAYYRSTTGQESRPRRAYPSVLCAVPTHRPGWPRPFHYLILKPKAVAGMARALHPSGLSCNPPTAALLNPCKQVASILLSCRCQSKDTGKQPSKPGWQGELHERKFLLGQKPWSCWEEERRKMTMKQMME